MLQINIQENKLEMVNSSYYIDESKVSKEDLDRIKEILANKDTMTKLELAELFMLCNANYSDVRVTPNPTVETDYSPYKLDSYEEYEAITQTKK